MRRPARLERAGALTARDRMWAAMRAIAQTGNGFSIAEIMVVSTASRAGGADTTPLLESTVAAYCAALEKGGFLEELTGKQTPPAQHRCLRLYRLIRDIGVEAPCVGKDG